jgi:TonB family protein
VKLRDLLLVCFLGCLTLADVAAQEASNGGGLRKTDYSKVVPVSRSLPVYPPEAGRNGQEGMVFIEFYVLDDGSVSRAKVLNTSPARLPLESAALEAVAKWRYEPSEFASRRIALQINFRKDGVVNVGGVNLPREAYELPQIRNTAEGAVLELVPPTTPKPDR